MISGNCLNFFQKKTLSVRFYSRHILIILLSLVFLCSQKAYSHGGGLNSQGCHNNTKTGNYHCHKNSGSNQSEKQTRSSKSEDLFNLQLARKLGGKNEVIYYYSFGLEGQSKSEGSIRVDIETENFVIEGGKDTRDSLDSVQQAVFASVVTGKKPAVAVYDTDGNWGKYEHRIWTASKALNIRFIWFQRGDIVEIQ